MWKIKRGRRSRQGGIQTAMQTWQSLRQFLREFQSKDCLSELCPSPQHTHTPATIGQNGMVLMPQKSVISLKSCGQSHGAAGGCHWTLLLTTEHQALAWRAISVMHLNGWPSILKHLLCLLRASDHQVSNVDGYASQLLETWLQIYQQLVRQFKQLELLHILNGWS